MCVLADGSRHSTSRRPGRSGRLSQHAPPQRLTAGLDAHGAAGVLGDACGDVLLAVGEWAPEKTACVRMHVTWGSVKSWSVIMQQRTHLKD